MKEKEVRAVYDSFTIRVYQAYSDSVERYVKDWIRCVTDVTDLAHTVRGLVEARKLDEARALLPIEKPYVLDPSIGKIVGIASITASV